MIPYRPLLLGWCGIGVVTSVTVLMYGVLGKQSFYPAMIAASEAGLLPVGMSIWLGLSGAILMRGAFDLLPISHLRWNDFDRVAASCFFHLAETLLGIVLCVLLNPHLKNSEFSVVCAISVQLFWKTLHQMEDMRTASLQDHSHTVPAKALVRPVVLVVLNGLAFTYTVSRPRLGVSPTLLILAYDFSTLAVVAFFQLLTRSLLMFRPPSEDWEVKLCKVSLLRLVKYTLIVVLQCGYVMYGFATLGLPCLNAFRPIMVSASSALREISRLHIRATLSDSLDSWMAYATHGDLPAHEDTPCVICFETMKVEDGNVKKLYPCKHMFHRNCIMAWYSRSMKTQCPYCRQRVQSQPRPRKPEATKSATVQIFTSSPGPV